MTRFIGIPPSCHRIFDGGRLFLCRKVAPEKPQHTEYRRTGAGKNDGAFSSVATVSRRPRFFRFSVMSPDGTREIWKISLDNSRKDVYNNLK